MKAIMLNVYEISCKARIRTGARQYRFITISFHFSDIAIFRYVVPNSLIGISLANIIIVVGLHYMHTLYASRSNIHMCM